MSIVRVRVSLLLQDRLVTTTLSTNGERLQDMLVRKTSNYLHLANTHIPTAGGGDTIVEESIVSKSQVGLIALKEDRHEAQDKRWFNFVEKTSCAASILVSGWLVVGQVHLKRALDPIVFLERASTAFFPMTDVTVSRSAGQRVELPVVFVNKAHVSLCSFDSDSRTCQPDDMELAACDLDAGAPRFNFN